MVETYDAAWAERTVAQLERRGVEFAAGLGTDEVDAIADAFGVAVPHELEVFLRTGVPVSPGWPRWADGAEAVAAEARSWIDGRFAFDIEKAQYWHPLLGERPASDEDAIIQALGFLVTAPLLLPLYSHRFLTTSGPGPGAVLSVWQPIDSVIYGNDLADYLAREFAIERPPWAASEAPPVPVWEDLFDLFCTRGR